jgi:hypothetical protein
MKHDAAYPVSRFPEPVASYSTYAEAETAVNRLAAGGLPVEGVTIVAGELKFIEQVTGRRGHAAAALDGALTGGATGALVGFVLGVFTAVAPLSTALTLAFWGLVLGAIVGALIGLLGPGLWGRRRRFSSVSTLDARRYDVMAPPEVAAQARRLLEEARIQRAA